MKKHLALVLVFVLVFSSVLVPTLLLSCNPNVAEATSQLPLSGFPQENLLDYSYFGNGGWFTAGGDGSNFAYSSFLQPSSWWESHSDFTFGSYYPIFNNNDVIYHCDCSTGFSRFYPTFTLNANGSYAFSGLEMYSAFGVNYFRMNFPNLIVGQNYTVTTTLDLSLLPSASSSPGVDFFVQYYDSSNNYVYYSYTGASMDSGVRSLTFTVPTGVVGMFVVIYCNAGVKCKVPIIKLEKGSNFTGFVVSDYSSGVGYGQGYYDGYALGSLNVNTQRYNEGYNAGHAAGVSEANNFTFLSLMSSVVDAPLTAFRSMFNFNLLGVNISSLLMALFSAAVIILVVKLILGGK